MFYFFKNYFFMLFVFFSINVWASSEVSVELKLINGEFTIEVEGEDVDYDFEKLELFRDFLQRKIDESPFLLRGQFRISLKDERAESFLLDLSQSSFDESLTSEETINDFIEELKLSSIDTIVNDSFASRGKNRVVIGSKVIVTEDEYIDELVVIGGTGEIGGRVQSLVSIGSTIDIFASASIKKQLISIGSQVNIDPYAHLEAEEVNLFLPGFESFRSFLSLFSGSNFLKWPWASLWTILTLLFFFLFGWLLIYIAPAFCTHTVESMNLNKAKSFLFGILGYFSFFPILLGLIISILGIALIPLYVILFSLIVFIGYLFGALFVGYILPIKFKQSILMCLLLGLILFELLKLIPFGMGFFVIFIFSTMGFGAVSVGLLKALKR